MSAEALRLLVRVTLASSAALLMIFALRRPIRALAGARVAYALWLLVPTLVLASLLPAPSQRLLARTFTLPEPLGVALAVEVGGPTQNDIGTPAILLAIWTLGVATMSFLMVQRQRAFSRSLTLLAPDALGLYRSAAVDTPLLAGLWNPKIVVPADFEARYSPEERELVLEHERMHARRGDVAVNAFATLWLCVSWFNPLFYRALGWLRADQELACDALVLAHRRDSRRSYAAALLKTQLATDAAWRAPIGCRWQSTHPLTERITMLKQPLPGFARRFGGFALVAVLTGVASVAAWAGKPAAGGAPILVDMKTTIRNPQTNEVRVFATRYLVHSGEVTKDEKGRPLDFSCTPWLADSAGQSAIANELKAHHFYMRPGQVLLECAMRGDGEVAKLGVLVVADGTWGTIEMTEHGGPRQFKIEVRPSTSAADIAAAKQTSDG
jgi:beta-lactamase regulating signal transducer with metallopeptidase domain